MSLSFNTNTSALGATSTPAKPAGFGAFSFGAQSSTAPAFGTQTSAAPAFGAQTTTPAFGVQAATSTATPFGTTPAFGTTGAFGATTSAPTLGGFGGFGTTSTSTSTAFKGFGTSTTSTPSLFGGFGTTTTSAPTAFGGFGTTTTSAPAAFGGFGTTTTSAPSFGGFGTGTSGFGGFGAAATTTSAPSFGGFGTTGTANTGFSGFGSFGSTFGKPATGTAPAFGGFGSSFGQPLQAQQQPQQQLNPEEAFAQSIFNVSIFGDERDTILAKWNYLQAMWGSGKSFYSQSAAPVDITPQNYLCRFKAMGYSRLPGKDNKAGLVSLVFNKSFTDVKNGQQQIITGLNQIFGNKPNITINIDIMKPLSDNKSQVVIYVEEKSQQCPNEIKRILATEVSNYLNQATVKPQLTNMAIEQALALVVPDEDQLKEYLENPPKGIDPRMWKQAKIDNPDSQKFIPVPMIGFNELKWRIKCQEKETEAHNQYLSKVEKDLTELKQRHAATTARIMEYRRKLAELSHRILKVIVKQESTRKVGMALSPEEEVLRSKLENMQALVSAPTQFKGRLSELLSQMRMQRNQWATTAANEYTLDKDSSEEMKSFLTMQQQAMELLIQTVNKDMKALKIISEGMTQLTRG
ncbi:unnamed protein product [Hermetia illucens]|uniref:Uncharacterized protein n=1 Tax=Hermetia illucens TaxID=343691 RepID=A0A7R8YMP8_HERIL|nr:probable nucleoporin Nup54 [Hermetia illucens]CAD7078421.1 unnamed protein product [Hermetia illucens]